MSPGRRGRWAMPRAPSAEMGEETRTVRRLVDFLLPLLRRWNHSRHVHRDGDERVHLGTSTTAADGVSPWCLTGTRSLIWGLLEVPQSEHATIPRRGKKLY